jgi:hypothetical protein
MDDFQAGHVWLPSGICVYAPVAEHQLSSILIPAHTVILARLRCCQRKMRNTATMQRKAWRRASQDLLAPRTNSLQFASEHEDFTNFLLDSTQDEMQPRKSGIQGTKICDFVNDSGDYPKTQTRRCQYHQCRFFKSTSCHPKFCCL